MLEKIEIILISMAFYYLTWKQYVNNKIEQLKTYQIKGAILITSVGKGIVLRNKFYT